MYPKLEKAVEKGYQILQFHEVWHFTEEQQRVGLFQEYVNTWLKIKEEASGWPEYVGANPIKQKEHVAKYYEKEQIQLDLDKIEKKSRSLHPGQNDVKLDVGKIWSNKTQVKEFDNPVKFHKFHDSDKYNVCSVSVLTEQCVEIHYKHQLQDNPVSPNLKIFIACFMTCHARLNLYEALDQLQERML